MSCGYKLGWIWLSLRQVGSITRKGRGHPSNEDRWISCDVPSETENTNGWANPIPVKLFAVFDGHGGPAVSEMLSKKVVLTWC